MTDPGSPADRLPDALHRVLGEVDPVPESLRAKIRASFALRTLDAELLALLGDSDRDEPAVTVRAAEPPRTVRFGGGPADPIVILQITSVRGRRRLLGQLLPPAGGGPPTGTVTVETAQGPVPASVDDLGGFTVEDLAPGPARLRFAVGDRGVVTPWIVL